MRDLLSEAEALDLFAEYYRRGAGPDLTRPERAAAERIVAALGWHALAVKLAAATAADTRRDLDAFARELGDPRHALDLTENEAPQAVRATFESSYQSLPEGMGRLFAALSAFATAEMGRGAVEALAGALGVAPAGASIDLLVRRALADGAMSAVLPEEGADRARLRLHPLMRAFAGERFAAWADDEQEDAHRAVAAYYADYANATADAALVVDEANIEGALDWAHAQDADVLVARLCLGVRDFWLDRGRARAALRYLPWGMATAERVAEATDDPRDKSRAAILELYYAQMLQAYAGRIEEAERLLAHNRQVWQALGRPRNEAIALDTLGQARPPGGGAGVLRAGPGHWARGGRPPRRGGDALPIGAHRRGTARSRQGGGAAPREPGPRPRDRARAGHRRFAARARTLPGRAARPAGGGLPDAAGGDGPLRGDGAGRRGAGRAPDAPAAGVRRVAVRRVGRVRVR